MENRCATYSAKSPVKLRSRKPGHVALARRDRRVIEPHLREIRGQFLDLQPEPRSQAVVAPADDLDLDVAPFAAPQRRHRGRAVLGGREQYAIVVDDGVIGRIEQVGIQSVHVDAGIQDAQAHFLRGAVRHRHLRPARCVRRRRGGKRRLARESGRVIELQSERRHPRTVVGRGNEVGRDAASREESTAIDGGPVDAGDAAAGPLELDDPLAASFGGLRERLGAHCNRVQRVDAVRERSAIDGEHAAGRTMVTGPGAAGEAVPSGARRRWRPGQHASVIRLRPGGQQARDRGHDAHCRVVFRHVLAHARGREEDDRSCACTALDGTGLRADGLHDDSSARGSEDAGDEQAQCGLTHLVLLWRASHCHAAIRELPGFARRSMYIGTATLLRSGPA